MNLNLPPVNLGSIGAEIILAIAASIILISGVFFPKAKKEIFGIMGLFGIVFAFIYNFYYWGKPAQIVFSGMLIVDKLGIFISSVFLLAAFITILLSFSYLKIEKINHFEYYVLIILSVIGMILMVKSQDLIMLFLGLETLSLSIYVLAGFLRDDPKSNEASLKYFLLGAFSSAFFLYGIALTYGACGTIKLDLIAEQIAQAGLLHDKFMLMGLSLLLVGFAFKVALVPFHMWVPDVYEGAPIPITAFMSVAPKAAGFVALLRVVVFALSEMQMEWGPIFWVLSVLTMTIGNIIAISQTSIIRMLAYSSIAHAGYILIGLTAANEIGNAGVLYYLLAYTFMNLGAFGVVIVIAEKGKGRTNIEDYSGMAGSYPLLAVTMAIFMFSLAGIPPFAGFFGKFYVFSGAIKAGYIWLAIIGVFNSLISVYFYLRVTVMMYMKDPAQEFGPVNFAPGIIIALILTVFFTLEMGIVPSCYIEIAKESIMLLM
ncbi:MAG: NADH-quinone oxidoreductase subunit N [Thermodesulfobacteriota bacterium]|nr:NADH-quinone oxidoreductase subunit N [Thermodesulfobacteriota bacterium]